MNGAGLIGRGEAVSFPSEASVEGWFTIVEETADTLALLTVPDELAQRVIWISEPLVTLVAPVMEHVAAILCSSGGPAAHVAIVARELGLPCLMRCSLDADGGPRSLDGRWIVVAQDGTLQLESDRRAR